MLWVANSEDIVCFYNNQNLYLTWQSWGYFISEWEIRRPPLRVCHVKNPKIVWISWIYFMIMKFSIDAQWGNNFLEIISFFLKPLPFLRSTFNMFSFLESKKVKSSEILKWFWPHSSEVIKVFVVELDWALKMPTYRLPEY